MRKKLIAIGGGGFLMELENPLLDVYFLHTTGKPKPKICFISTASGDAQDGLARFYDALHGTWECHHNTDGILPAFHDCPADRGVRLKRRRMIGLKRGTVQMVAYQAEWPDLFEQERHVLHQHIGRFVLDIQHVGSTAVPGLDAKPIIDIAVAVASLAVIPQCRPLLCTLGYLDRGDAGGDGGYLFVKESAPDVRTHHLHLVARDDPQWNNYLRFRDMLRADETLRTTYAALKKSLQTRFAQDRKAYTAAKEDFIRGVLIRASEGIGNE